jgi:hypothetical protein
MTFVCEDSRSAGAIIPTDNNPRRWGMIRRRRPRSTIALSPLELTVGASHYPMLFWSTGRFPPPPG